jgi:hypothetical protein
MSVASAEVQKTAFSVDEGEICERLSPEAQQRFYRLLKNDLSSRKLDTLVESLLLAEPGATEDRLFEVLAVTGITDATRIRTALAYYRSHKPDYYLSESR